MANRFKVVNNSAVPPRPEVRRKTRNPVTVKSHTTGPWSLQQKNTLHITFISLSLYPYIVSLRKWSPSYPQLLGKRENVTLVRNSWRKATPHVSRMILSFRFYQESWAFWGRLWQSETHFVVMNRSAVTPISKAWYKKWHFLDIHIKQLCY